MMNRFQQTAPIWARKQHQERLNRKAHFLSRQKLHRRAFLGSSAAIVSLPFLESALHKGASSAHAADCTTAQRFFSWYVPNGIHMPDWTPTTAGQDWEMPYILEPLEPFRQKLLVITGLDHHDTAYPSNPPGGHGSGTGCFLTMRPVAKNENDPARTSLDQMILQQAMSTCNRPISSLQFAPAVKGDGCDRTDCSFLQTISWERNTPFPMEGNARRAFNRVFEGVDAGEPDSMSDMEAERRAAQRTSVLDYVGEEASLMSGSLGQADRGKLEEYLTGLRELETRIDNLAANAGEGCQVMDEPAQNIPYQDLVPVLADLMAVAFQCDQTRVGTLMTAQSGSMQNFEWLVGQSSEHHRVSHHFRDDRNLEILSEIGRWETEMLARFLQKLDSTIEADGTSILDKTLVYFSSEIGDGNGHFKYDVPVVTVGSANGRFRADGSHIMYTKMEFPRPTIGPRGGPNTGRLMVSMLNAFGIETDEFGFVSGNLNEDFLI